MIRIETTRCILQPFTEEYLDAFISYRNDEQWMKYQGLKGLTREEYKEKILVKPTLEKGMQLALLDCFTNTLLGDIYLKKEATILWIGYTLHPMYSRKGYVNEALKGVVEWAKLQGIQQIQAGVLPANLASIKVLEKMGFIYIHKEEEEQIYQLLIG